ncbi:MAG: methyltransferase domain-containing protein [Caldilineaceae bacterium]|nr:methyltransferase domain-containing protein [Caldilineaceae bacterium]
MSKRDRKEAIVFGASMGGLSQNNAATERSQQHQRDGYSESVPRNYERYFVPAIGAPLAHDLIRIAALRPGERVLDVACGTGVVARLAAQAAGAPGSVAGLDITPGMLAVARKTTPPAMAIDWHEASAEAMPLPDASFDAVLCQMGLQFVPDKDAALREMRRVLAPGGRLILNVPGPTPQLFAIMGEALARHIGAGAAGFVNHVFSLHDTAELRKLINGAGFRDVSVQGMSKTLRLPAPAEFLWQYVYSTPLAGAVAQVNDERRSALERDVVTKWQDFVKNDALEFQVRIVVATARK